MTGQHFAGLLLLFIMEISLKRLFSGNRNNALLCLSFFICTCLFGWLVGGLRHSSYHHLYVWLIWFVYLFHLAALCISLLLSMSIAFNSRFKFFENLFSLIVASIPMAIYLFTLIKAILA